MHARLRRALPASAPAPRRVFDPRAQPADQRTTTIHETFGAIRESTWVFTSQGAVRLPLRVYFTGAPADVRRVVISLAGVRDQDVNALSASLFIDGLAGVELIALPTSHLEGPDYLNVLRFLDVPQAAAMAAARQPVKWRDANPDDWSWTTQAARQLGWPAERLQW